MLLFLCSPFLWNLFKMLAQNFYQQCSPTEISMSTLSRQKSTYFKFPSLAGANRCSENRLKNKYIYWLFSGYLPHFQESAVQELLEPGTSSVMVRLLGLTGPWGSCIKCLTCVFTLMIQMAKLNTSLYELKFPKEWRCFITRFPCRSNK